MHPPVAGRSLRGSGGARAVNIVRKRRACGKYRASSLERASARVVAKVCERLVGGRGKFSAGELLRAEDLANGLAHVF
jgi:hypothetical protein